MSEHQLKDKEPCPKCSTLHIRGDYELQPGTKRYTPRDVHCQCGLLLRWSVPLFKMTASGYILRIVRDDETPFTEEPK